MLRDKSIVAVLFCGVLTVLLLFSSCSRPVQNADDPVADLGCQHIGGEWIVDQEATFKDAGAQYKVCTVCEEIIETEVIPRKICTHDSTEWITDAEATTEQNGSRHEECSTCAEILCTENIPRLLSQEEIAEKLSKAIVKVTGYALDGLTVTTQGSGFFIDDKGTFVTNAHVINECYYVKIQNFAQGNVYSNSTMHSVDMICAYNDSTSDYAICRASSCEIVSTVEFAQTAEVGDTVYALGFPNDAAEVEVSKGAITNTDAVDGSAHYYVNTAEIDHGSSGGVLVDAYGRVLGITTASTEGKDYLAVPYRDFKEDLEKEYTTAKTPLDFFHQAEKIELNAQNVEDFFEIVVRDAYKTSTTSAQYNIHVRLKEKYSDIKLAPDCNGVEITLKVDTIYDYYADTSQGDVPKQKIDSKQLYFFLRNENEMAGINGGVTKMSQSAIPLPPSYRDMEISYEMDFFDAAGTLMLYQ